MTRTVAVRIFLLVTLYSCAPSQDTSPDARESDLRAREEVFQVAYAELDAAILARLLTDDYVIRQLDQATERSKSEWLAELQALRDVFPRMRITVDGSDLTLTENRATVSGQRTFTWSEHTEIGTYREHFQNRWQMQDGVWVLRESEVRALP